LENAIEHAAVLSRSGAITPELLPSNIVLGSGAPAGPARGARSLGQVEKQHIRAVLAESGGNRTRAAAVLGISPTTLWRRLKVADRS
jgi:DNA-binding NtrC family response regulator